ncbi:MAG: hypothetical protein CMK09_06330 [Ponticaulis sp.]|nr:hypothetical protein [Ponticaulis sp.]|tara:strand:- start:6731 stop:7123 length:393 start_codon:yes stop_codon:yes gene_type:complete
MFSVIVTGLASAAHAEVSNSVEVLKPPIVAFPQAAAAPGIRGHCEVRFDLEAYGETVLINEVRCSNKVFCQTAASGIRMGRYKVIDAKGTETPGEKSGLVYPITYSMNGERVPDTGELEVCPVDETGLIG